MKKKHLKCNISFSELESNNKDDDDDDDDDDYLDSLPTDSNDLVYTNSSMNSLDEIGVRHKRQADQYEYTPTKTRCPLLLVADYRFYQEMGASNSKTTINYLVSSIICS